MAAVRAPEGDFRPWDEIEAWADEIAAALEAQPARPDTARPDTARPDTQGDPTTARGPGAS